MIARHYLLLGTVKLALGGQRTGEPSVTLL